MGFPVGLELCEYPRRLALARAATSASQAAVSNRAPSPVAGMVGHDLPEGAKEGIPGRRAARLPVSRLVVRGLDAGGVALADRGQNFFSVAVLDAVEKLGHGDGGPRWTGVRFQGSPLSCVIYDTGARLSQKAVVVETRPSYLSLTVRRMRCSLPSRFIAPAK